VAVLGAAGGIGQPLSLLLKQCPLVASLRLYDIANVAGVAADLSHVNTRARVVGFTGPEQLGAALSGCDLVVMPAGIPRKPGMSRDDLFTINAGIVRDLVAGVAKHCPAATLNIISNPVNSTVPIAAEVLKAHGCYDPARLMGVTHLDVMRARTFVADAKGVDPSMIDIPVVGGHAGVTILPLLSQTTPWPPGGFSAEELHRLTDRIQNGGTEVVEAKAGAGSATLSMAAAAAHFAHSCLRAMDGERGVVECAYVASHVTALSFFASQVRLGPCGVEQVMGLGQMTLLEKAGLEKLMPELEGSIAKGVAFVKKGKPPQH
jgi:malate dehydrogenase